MVELPGSLERSTLGDVLGALYRSRVTGALRLEELGTSQGHHHMIFWRDGLIHHVETTRRPLAKGWSRQDPRHVRAAQWTFDDLSKGQRLERLEALFQLTRARISFRVMGPVRAPAAAPLGPDEFLRGRPRLRDGESKTPTPPPSNALETPRARALRTLGLCGEPGQDAVRAAFRQMARRWHPDRHPAAGEQTRAALCRRFAHITNAYEQLLAEPA